MKALKAALAVLVLAVACVLFWTLELAVRIPMIAIVVILTMFEIDAQVHAFDRVVLLSCLLVGAAHMGLNLSVDVVYYLWCSILGLAYVILWTHGRKQRV